MVLSMGSCGPATAGPEAGPSSDADIESDGPVEHDALATCPEGHDSRSYGLLLKGIKPNRPLAMVDFTEHLDSVEPGHQAMVLHITDNEGDSNDSALCCAASTLNGTTYVMSQDATRSGMRFRDQYFETLPGETELTITASFDTRYGSFAFEVVDVSVSGEFQTEDRCGVGQLVDGMAHQIKGGGLLRGLITVDEARSHEVNIPLFTGNGCDVLSGYGIDWLSGNLDAPRCSDKSPSSMWRYPPDTVYYGDKAEGEPAWIFELEFAAEVVVMADPWERPTLPPPDER